MADLPDELPEGLVWITNDEDPTFASPEAKRGGTLRLAMASFPLTLRRVGPDSNGGFAGFLRPNQMALVVFHPDTRRPMPQSTRPTRRPSLTPTPIPMRTQRSTPST